MSSGGKRARADYGDGYNSKRHRDEPKDWRDVHLKSDGRRRDVERDTSRDSSRRDRDRGSRRSRSRDRHRPDSRRDSYRGSSHRNHNDDRDRDRRRDVDDVAHRRQDNDRPRRNKSHSHSRSQSTSRRERNGTDKLHTNGVNRSKQDDVELEEGEISPGNSRRPTPTPSTSTRAVTPQVTPSQKQTEPEPDLELQLDVEKDAAREAEAARLARRQAIRAKLALMSDGNLTSSAGASSGSSSAVQQPPHTPSESNAPSQNHSAVVTSGVLPLSASQSMRDSPVAESPGMEAFDISKVDKEGSAESSENLNGEQVSAADYDDSLDRMRDEEKRIRAVVAKDETKEDDIEMIEVEEDEEQVDDIDDMFALDAPSEKKKKKVKKIVKPAVPALVSANVDSAADSEGYYTVILGEHLDGGRYQIFASLGKGMFANVVRARILEGEAAEIGREVAIKIVRCQESMYKAGLKEVQILNKLSQADPEDKKHVVRLERTFEHRGHLCLVFESLSMNLRDVVKKFGKDVGLNIRAVRAYAHQLFLAMSLLRKCNIMHADIKPDNILVNEQKTLLKVCDLGSASDVSENDITPYLVSRFYRSPEIILGAPYDFAIDTWSIGCTLYELYTGKILFPGRSNNHMLLLMMELKGKFNAKMIKKAKFGEQYFDEMGAFESIERDRVSGSDVFRKVHISKPSRDLRARLLPPSAKMADEEAKIILSFIDLLDKCLMLDPSRRITPKEALAHPFIRG